MAPWTQPVDARHVASLWPFCVEHAQAALELTGTDQINLGDLYRYLIKGQMTLWVVISNQKVAASSITEVINYPRIRVVRIVTLGGKNMKYWLPGFNDKLEEYARKVGATRLEGGGRKGWPRALKEFGYEDAGSVIRKDLDPAGEEAENVVTLKSGTEG